MMHSLRTIPHLRDLCPVLEPLHSGRHAGVSKGVCYLPTAQTVAIKSVPKQRHDLPAAQNHDILRRELAHLTLLTDAQRARPPSHRHVAGLIDAVQDATHVHLILEHAPHGTLSSLLGHAAKAKAEATHATHATLRRLLRALAFVHAHRIVHGDLKPENVLVMAPAGHDAAGGPDLRLCDFGSSHALPDAPPDAPWAYTWQPFSTPAYAAPEVFQGRYGLPSDLYSFGKMLLDVADAANHSASARLRERAVPFLESDPGRRPTVQDALAMDWDDY